MLLHHETVNRLSETLKQRRHFTMAEQMQGREILTAVERTALAHFGLRHADKQPTANDDAETALLKRKGLFEVRAFAQDPSSDLDDKQRSMVLGLVIEQCHDYVTGERHPKGLPPQHAQAEAARAAKARQDALLALEPRVAALEAADAARSERFVSLGDVRSMFEPFQPLLDAVETLKTRCEALERRCEALEAAAMDAVETLKTRCEALERRCEALEAAATAPKESA